MTESAGGWVVLSHAVGDNAHIVSSLDEFLEGNSNGRRGYTSIL